MVEPANSPEQRMQPGASPSGRHHDDGKRTRVGVNREGLTTPPAAKPPSRAVTLLATKLIARDINYRQEFEAIMETFGAVFPKSCLENFFETHAIALPNNRQLMILTLYQAGEDGDRIDGVSLLKDLDRAAFKRFAIASSKGAPGADAGSKRASVTSVQKSDKSRILTLVSTQLNRDKSFSINAGGTCRLTGPPPPPARFATLLCASLFCFLIITMHLQSRSKCRCGHCVPCTSASRSASASSLVGPAGNGGNDPDFKKLGQTGRDALRKRLARRSMFQQQEIIANAVVAAARAAVEPSVRRAENSIHSAAPSRMGSFQQSRSGSLNRGTSVDAIGGGPMRPRSAAPPRASGVSPGAKRPSEHDAVPLRPAPLLHSDKANGGAEHDNKKDSNLYHSGGGGGVGRAPATPPHVAPRSPAHPASHGHASGAGGVGGGGGGHELDAAEAAIRRLAAKSFGRAAAASDAGGDQRHPMVKPSTAASSGAGGGQGRSPRRSTDDNGVVDIHGAYSNGNKDAAARSASGIKKHCSAASRASAAGSGSGALRGASAGLSDEDEDDGGESLPGRTLHSPGPAPVLGSPSRRQSSSTSHPHSPIPLTAAGSHRALDLGVPPAVAEEPSE
eukprot:XP_001699110.1 predicted protein [Chlamydomonas reinhardtii]